MAWEVESADFRSVQHFSLFPIFFNDNVTQRASHVLCVQQPSLCAGGRVPLDGDLELPSF